jgi:hypothetical protein
MKLHQGFESRADSYLRSGARCRTEYEILCGRMVGHSEVGHFERTEELARNRLPTAFPPANAQEVLVEEVGGWHSTRWDWSRIAPRVDRRSALQRRTRSMRAKKLAPQRHAM